MPLVVATAVAAVMPPGAVQEPSPRRNVEEDGVPVAEIVATVTPDQEPSPRKKLVAPAVPVALIFGRVTAPFAIWVAPIPPSATAIVLSAAKLPPPVKPVPAVIS
ncbi:hypothetical protein [Caudoviricetes sp.]|nr:hypothetical protein [Caudoviricetes sp.]